mmetsp:Transcript_7226/g.19359  ORF Transcript_7226/g.19359 Transcript_7226/m.19359 type:complete len:260 (-) Transcript_7226:242-1021(-)
MEKHGRTEEGRALIRELDGRSEYDTLFKHEPTKEDRMLEHVYRNATYRDPASVLKAIDDFGWKHWMMNVGDGAKTEALEGVLTEKNPTVVLELGGYCGYSALRMSRLLPEESRIFSVEPHPHCVAIASAVHAYAGVPQGRIQILNGTLESVLPVLRERLTLEFGPERSGEKCRIDLAFLDHDKVAYLSDFQLLDSSGLLQQGAVVVADNVIFPGAPEYLEHVRALDTYSSRFVPGLLEYVDDESRAELHDGVEISTRVS